MDKDNMGWIVRGREGEMLKQQRQRKRGEVYKASGTGDRLGGRLGLAKGGG